MSRIAKIVSRINGAVFFSYRAISPKAVHNMKLNESMTNGIAWLFGVQNNGKKDVKRFY